MKAVETLVLQNLSRTMPREIQMTGESIVLSLYLCSNSTGVWASRQAGTNKDEATKRQ